MAEVMLKTLLWVFAATAAMARGQVVPCYFVFGDSFFANGNDNALNTSAKVNYLPYGSDFARGPTGRFSNGRNIPDIIAKRLKFRDDDIPPFMGASPEQAHTGINYASGGAGLREETSQHLGERISFEEQIMNHRRIIMTAKVPEENLKKCLYIINIGTNDYLNNYFMPAPYNTSGNYSVDQYADTLIKSYRFYLKLLYVLGARKVGVFGLSRLGCTPRMRISHGGGERSCVAQVNNAVEPFNKKLKALVDAFNVHFPDATSTFVDIFTSQNTIDYISAGYLVRDQSCCKVKQGEELCVPNEEACVFRRQYVYWDNVHGTEDINRAVASAAISALMESGTF